MGRCRLLMFTLLAFVCLNVNLYGQEAAETLFFIGQVLNPDMTPLAKAKVMIGDANSEFSITEYSTIETDDEGKFRYEVKRKIISNRDKIQVKLAASSSDMSLLAEASFEYDASKRVWTSGFQDAVLPAEILTTPTKKIELLVVDTDDKPVSQAKIWFFSSLIAQMGVEISYPTIFFYSDDSGKCDVFIPEANREQKLAFIVHKEGRPKKRFELELSKVDAPMTVKLENGLSDEDSIKFVAQILRPDKTPLSKAKVTLKEAGQTVNTISDQDGFVAYTLKENRKSRSSNEYYVTVLVENEDQSLISNNDYLFFWKNQEWLGSKNGVTSIVTLTTQKVPVVVLDHNNTPIPNATVWFYQNDRERPGLMWSTNSQRYTFLTDQNGKCDVLIPGKPTNSKFSFVVIADHFAATQQSIDIDEIDGPVPIDLKSGIEYTVTVTNEAGEPMENAYVSLESIEYRNDTAGSIPIRTGLHSKMTNAAGEVTFSCIPTDADIARFDVYKQGFRYGHKSAFFTDYVPRRGIAPTAHNSKPVVLTPKVEPGATP